VIACEEMPGWNKFNAYHSWDVLPTVEIQLGKYDDEAEAGTNEEERAVGEAILLADITDKIYDE
jgi:hypothetical protein